MVLCIDGHAADLTDDPIVRKLLWPERIDLVFRPFGTGRSRCGENHREHAEHQFGANFHVRGLPASKKSEWRIANGECKILLAIRHSLFASLHGAIFGVNFWTRFPVSTSPV